MPQLVWFVNLGDVTSAPRRIHMAVSDSIPKVCVMPVCLSVTRFCMAGGGLHDAMKHRKQCGGRPTRLMTILPWGSPHRLFTVPFSSCATLLPTKPAGEGKTTASAPFLPSPNVRRNSLRSACAFHPHCPYPSAAPPLSVWPPPVSLPPVGPARSAAPPRHRCGSAGPAADRIVSSISELFITCR